VIDHIQQVATKLDNLHPTMSLCLPNTTTDLEKTSITHPAAPHLSKSSSSTLVKMSANQETVKELPNSKEWMLLLHLATIADIPTSVMIWLVNNDAIESVRDLTILRHDDILKLQGEYQETASPYAIPWSSIVTNNLEYLIQWLISFHYTFGGFPHPCILTKEHFAIDPESLQWYWKKHGSNFETVTSSNSSNSIVDIGQRHSNYNILAYPRFSGLAKDWIEFDRSFQAVATAQSFRNILQQKERKHY